MEFKIRGHELDDQYRHFILKDKTIFEEMLEPKYDYGKEFTEAYKEFIQNLKPDDLITIIDTLGDICYLTEKGCPHKQGDVCPFLETYCNSIELTSFEYDHKIAKEYGIEINKTYTHKELTDILEQSRTPERLKKYA